MEDINPIRTKLYRKVTYSRLLLRGGSETKKKGISSNSLSLLAWSSDEVYRNYPSDNRVGSGLTEYRLDVFVNWIRTGNWRLRRLN